MLLLQVQVVQVVQARLAAALVTDQSPAVAVAVAARSAAAAAAVVPLERLVAQETTKEPAVVAVVVPATMAV